ncbi:unnamed protein product [Amoebophrya sp. A25]|nr:unnamed protein product [Amoebophrya sp. A25]|eukprot:GSA25T00007368001.1
MKIGRATGISKPFELMQALCGGGDRSFGRMMGLHPCKSLEEKSCNLVGAMCGQVLKMHFPQMADGTRARVGKKCNTADINIDKPNPLGKSMDNCNARMVDMPYLMRNKIADMQGSAIGVFKNNFYLNKALNTILGTSWPADAPPTMTVWGTSIHGKTGSWSMDSGTEYIYDHIYRIPQVARGFPPPNLVRYVPGSIKKMVGELEDVYLGRDDTYVCDSRDNPSQCALIGGDVWKCLKHYDAKRCHFCEDAGDSLRCDVRGWNTHGDFWERVPIYPRDVLGEMFRDEWRDFYARALPVKVEIPKMITRNVTNFKMMPWHMVRDAPPNTGVFDRLTTLPFGDANLTNIGVGVR